jgi:hypothetical protein
MERRHRQRAELWRDGPMKCSFTNESEINLLRWRRQREQVCIPFGLVQLELMKLYADMQQTARAGRGIASTLPVWTLCWMQRFANIT